jgi:2-oxoisovalerate dehydrogenase E2 component (dihydrolipoyl transacylase)
VAIREFRLPDPGEGLVEADIVTWRVAVGDQIKVNDILVEVETSKSLVELPSPFAGTVSALLVNEGDTVDVGRSIIAIDDGTGEAESSDRPVPGAARDDLVPEVPAPAGEGPDAAVPEGGGAPEGRVSVLVGYGPRTTDAKRRPRKGVRPAERAPATAQAADTFSVASPVSRRTDARNPLRPQPAEVVGQPLPGPGTIATEPASAGQGVLAKPPVRKLAKDLGVDLSAVVGSGVGGVITRDDVEAASGPEPVGARPEPRPAPVEGRPSAGAGHAARGDVRIPIKGVRKSTAQAMVTSAFTAPHVSEWVTCDVSATVELLDRLRRRREFAEIKISSLVIIAKAVCLALARTPQLNSAWDEQAGEIVLKGSVNLGIAVATPRGLMVPNLKSAESLDLVELATAMNELVTTAREGRSQPADLARGSFTITNVGVFGVDAGTPILNPGESGILCVGQIARRPWVVGTGDQERIEPRWVTTLAVSFDHRLADGEQGSRFLTDVAGVLADPGLALLY